MTVAQMIKLLELVVDQDAKVYVGDADTINLDNLDYGRLLVPHVTAEERGVVIYGHYHEEGGLDA